MSHFITKYLSKVDQFGDSFVPRINHNDKQHKSVIGGVGSITIYSLSFSYFLYAIVQWGTYQNLPKVTLTTEVLDQFTIDVNQVIAKIFARYNKNSAVQIIDPFDPNNMVLMATLLTVQNNNPLINQTQILVPIDQPLYDVGTMNISNLKFALNSEQLPNFLAQEYIVTIKNCNQTILDSYKSGLKCANSTYIDSYWKQALNRITIGTQVQQYNIQKQEMQSILKQQSVNIEQDKCQSIQNFLRIGTVNVDTGILLPNIQTQTIIYDLSTNQQTVSQTYIPQFFGDHLYLMINFKLDYLQVQQNIEFQKIADALADIGSIVSILMMGSYFITEYNEYTQNQYIYRKVIEMYYPEMKSIDIKKNIFGKTIKIVNNKNVTEYNVNSFMEYYNRLSLIAKQKLTYLNHIYEVSRLQFLVEKQIDQIAQLQDCCLKLSQQQNKSNKKLNELSMRNTPVGELIQIIQVATPANEELQIEQEEENPLNQAQNYRQYVFLLMHYPDIQRQLIADESQSQIQ